MNPAAMCANRRKLLILVVLVLLCAAGYMLVEVNFSNPKLPVFAMKLRVPRLAAMLLTAAAIGGASLVFQSIINNTIVPPCLLGMISRLIAHDSGLVDFEGKDIGRWKSKDLAKRLAILSQSSHIQMKLTVRELVTFGRFSHSGSRITPEDQKIIDRAISYMELEEFQDRFLDELSGGQRQRALLAMAIAQDTEYALLDELTNNLDVYHAANLLEVPCDPWRIAVLDMASLDILDALGVGERVVGAADISLDYLRAYARADVANLGAIKEADLEAVISANGAKLPGRS